MEFYFRQGYATLSPSFRNNGVRFDSLLHHVVQLCKDSTCHVRLIRIVSGASPKGLRESTGTFPTAGAWQWGTYLKERLAPDTCFFEMESKGVDWIGLAGLVAVSDMPHRSEVLDILYNTPEWVIRDGAIVDSRKKRLQRLYGGRAWQYMESFFFPELRKTEIFFYLRTPVRPEGRNLKVIPISKSLLNDLPSSRLRHPFDIVSAG